jgi:hypothetical protein
MNISYESSSSDENDLLLLAVALDGEEQKRYFKFITHKLQLFLIHSFL